MNNLPAFITGIRAFDIQVKNACELRIKQIASKVLYDIVTGTPVETGLAKGNWHVNKNSPSFDVLDRTDPDGSSTIADGISVINSFSLDVDRIIYIENSLKYISALEDGHSSQAPGGMVSIAISNIRGM